jgi:hypothetical protein
MSEIEPLVLEIMQGRAGMAVYLNGTRIAGPAHNGTMSRVRAFALSESDAAALRETAARSQSERVSRLEEALTEAAGAIGVCIDGFEKSNPTLGGLAAIHMLKEARERYTALLALNQSDGGGSG